MPVPSVFKSAPFLYGTTGTVGAAGVVATGGQFLGSGGGEEHTTENTPFVGKFKSKPDASTLKLDENSVKATIDGSYSCFSNFFANTQFPSSSSQNTLNSIEPFTKVNPPTSKSEENPVGCMVMQLSYDVNDTKKPKGVFKGEITIKSGNIGWALWLSGYGGIYEQYNTQYGQRMDYKLVFLEKENEDSGQIKTGLGGVDWITTNYFSVYVADPKGSVGINEYVQKDFYEEFKGLTANPKSQVLSYSGVWGVQKDGKEVFGDVNILEKNEEYAKIFLGREGGFVDDISSDYIHIYDEGNGKSLSSSANPKKIPKEDLNKWYAPFNGKKGKGMDADSYCTAYENACTSE